MPDFPFDPDLLRHVSPIEWKKGYRAKFQNLKIKTQLESAPPRTPWVGVLLEPALLAGSPAMKWLEDFVGCLPWSVLDRALSRADHGAEWVN